ncbi:hypothetical protein THIX_30674 [Thiomonas sp. X19]|nr:hypothetical protein THIX_30674 [Thiomonas sp. X19]
MPACASRSSEMVRDKAYGQAKGHNQENDHDGDEFGQHHEILYGASRSQIMGCGVAAFRMGFARLQSWVTV